MKEPIWVRRDVVPAVHTEQLAEHGGGAGTRDEGLLDSALARPRNLYLYNQGDLPALAAAYAFGIARNRPFIDGNKRTAFVAAELSLNLNDMELVADDAACVLIMLDLASGKIGEEEFGAWLRANTRPRG